MGRIASTVSNDHTLDCSYAILLIHINRLRSYSVELRALLALAESSSEYP